MCDIFATNNIIMLGLFETPPIQIAGHKTAAPTARFHDFQIFLFFLFFVFVVCFLTNSTRNRVINCCFSFSMDKARGLPPLRVPFKLNYEPYLRTSSTSPLIIFINFCLFVWYHSVLKHVNQLKITIGFFSKDKINHCPGN